MAVRVYLRSPVAIAWTLVGGLVVGGLAVGGWLVASMLRGRGIATDPLFLGGFGELVYLVAVFLLLVLLAVVWLPFGAGVAHAVGRRARGNPASLRTSVSAVLDAIAEMGRWLKTRIAVPGLAERLLTTEDVAPTEVVTGCAPFVVPALVLDAPDALERAVDRANRVSPTGGRERLLAGALGATLLATVGVYLGGVVVTVPVAAAGSPLAVGLLVTGVVVTAALDAAWRAETYASQDLSEGFRQG